MNAQNPIPRFRPVIRVFVSSTFSDLKPERNALQAQVFPRLEQLCAQNGFQFQAIDLRWGVSSEAGLDHRTMRICLDELRRAQDISPEPNFLVLLGNRYGWRPLPEAISHAEFEQLAAKEDSGGENHAPIPGTHGKTARQVLGDWYRCDENVVVPDLPETSPDRAPLNYLLQPRTQNLGDGRNYTRGKDGKDTPDWLEVQQVLWRIINAAFPAAALDRRFELDWAQHVAEVNDRQHPRRAIPQIARFQASATEQEIWCGALSAANAERHVIACFREIANRGEFAPAELNDFFDVTETGEFDAASAKNQTDLKTAIKHRLGDKAIVPIPFSRLKRENGKVVVDASETEMKKFFDDVFEKIRAIIERQFEEYWGKTEKASAERTARELEIEQQEHERFGRERGGKDSFVGRKTELEKIHDYLQNGPPWPLVIRGFSGCGKTALLARAFEEIPKARKPIIRFIGTTPQSSDVRSLLRSLCQQLRLQHPREGELPTDIKLLSEELQEHFKSAKADEPVILFLDALDQLSDADNGRLLNWIPTGQLPPHVKLVVSCLSDRAKDDPAGQPFVELTRRQLIAKNSINLDALSEEDASTLLFKNWLHQAGRKVSDQQRERIEQILKSKECRQPIYLKLLFEEAKLWRSYDAALELGESVPAILGQLIKRLGQPANHGQLLVERVLGYLAASRHGLAENEILEVLFADPDYKKALKRATKKNRHELPASATRIPVAIWSRLRFDLAPYLTERAAPGADVVTFYHRQVAEWVQEHFVKASEHRWQPHRRLADYFRNLADPRKDRSWLGDSIRAFGELPFQLAQPNDLPNLKRLLLDFIFLERKAICGVVPSARSDGTLLFGGVYDLISDFDMFFGLRKLRAKSAQNSGIHASQQWLTELRQLLHDRSHFIELLPDSIFQECYNAAENGSLNFLANRWLKQRGKHNHPWFRRLNRPNQVAKITRLVGLTHVDAVGFTNDGRFIVGVAGREPLCVWDAESNQLVTTVDTWPPLIASLKQHEAATDPARLEFLNLCKAFGNVRNGNNHGFAALENVIGVLIDHSILCLISVPAWDVKMRPVDASCSLEHLTATAGRFFLISGMNFLTLNSAGDILSSVALPGLVPESLAVSQDGATAVTIDRVGRVNVIRCVDDVWQIKSVFYLRRIADKLSLVTEGHSAVNDRWSGVEQTIIKLSLDPTGKTVCCKDSSLGEAYLFEFESLACHHCFKGFSSSRPTFSPNGRLVAFASGMAPGKLLGLYSVKTGACRYATLPHSNDLTGFAFSPDGTKVATGSIDGTISVIRTNQTKPLKAISRLRTSCGDSILGALVSPDKRIVACWSVDKYVMGYSLENGRQIFTTEKLGWDDSSMITKVGLSANGNYLFVNQGEYNSSCVRIWQIAEDGLRLVFDTDGELRKWCSTDQGPFARMEEDTSECGCTFSVDGKKAAVVRVGRCFLIDLASGSVLHQMELTSPINTSPTVRMNDEGAVFVRYESPGERSVFRWRPEEKEFHKISGELDLPAESSGEFLRDNLKNFEIRRRDARLDGFIAEILIRTEFERPRVISSYAASADISFLGLVPNGDRIVVGDHGGDIAICALENFSPLV